MGIHICGLEITNMKFKQWLEIGIGKRDASFDAFYEFASNDLTYPWKKSFDKQVAYLMIHHTNEGHLEVLRDAYFAYMTVWL